MARVLIEDIERGAGKTVTFTFRDKDGNPKDPASVTIYQLNPGLTVAANRTADAVHAGVGIWTLDVDLDTAGMTQLYAVSTGDPKAAIWVALQVNSNPFP